MSVSQEEADLAKRVAEMEEEIARLKAQTESLGEGYASAYSAMEDAFANADGHLDNVFALRKQLTDWKLVAGELAALLKDCPAQFASADEAFEGEIVAALAAFEAMEKATK